MRIWKRIKRSGFESSFFTTIAGGRGFWGGGSTGGFHTVTNLIDGIDFTTFAILNSASALGTARSTPTGVQNANLKDGYFCGGHVSEVLNQVNTIDRFSFFDDTSIVNTASLSVARNSAAGFSSLIKGYVASGAAGLNNNIQHIVFATNTNATNTAVLSIGRYGAAGIHSSTRGYVCGGLTGSPLTDLDGFTFSTETAYNPSAALSTPTGFPSGISAPTKGYIGGGTGGSLGDGTGTLNFKNLIRALTFSDETAVTISGTLSIARPCLAGVYSTTAGFWGGGGNAGSGGSDIGATIFSTVDGINFSNEVTGNMTVTLGPRYTFAGISNNGLETSSVNRGYWAGGTADGGIGLDEIDGINFANETIINPSAVLPSGNSRFGLAGVQSIGRGYFGGGITSGVSYTNEIDGLIFHSETAINPSSSLTSSLKTNTGGVSSSNSGYWAGGNNGTNYYSIITKMSFATENVGTSSSSISPGRKGLAGANSSTSGYWAGGYTGSARNEISKIVFTTDVVTNIGATLSVAREGVCGVSSSNSGYWAGGSNSGSTEIDGIMFSNDTAINPSAVLSTARTGCGGTNSLTKGYFGGGFQGGTGYVNVIDSINFSNDTASNLGSLLTVARGYLAGVSSK